MMGDLKRGRTVRSLCRLLRHYRDVRVVFISPPAFEMESDIKDYLGEHRIEYTEVANLHQVLPELDAIYVTRMQSEYDTDDESSGVDLTRFSINSGELRRMKSSAVIMHPLPRGPEIHPSVDKDPRSMYWRQERNGMWIRAALIASVLGATDQIRDAESRFTT